jgi:uncharacterized protein (TIGR03437 family)
VRRLSIVSALCCATAGIVLAAFFVGGGAPNAAVLQSFMAAFSRGGFSALVVQPTGNVGPLGSPGLVQTFQWANDTSLTAALVAPDASGTITLQMYPDLYTFFLSTGVSTAGYPITDTTACPFNTYGTCDYQLFAKDYALFVYSNPSGANYTVFDPFYTEWLNVQGISGPLGPASGASVAVTSESGTQGTQQLFAGGAIYSYTATGAAAASTYAVSSAIYTAYANAGGIATLGFPTADEVLFTGGQLRQPFENGRILWTSGSPASVLFPIKTVAIAIVPSSNLTLDVGQTATLTATATDTQGHPATGRTLTWSTSNGSAVTVQGAGYTATIRAVGAGSARIQATGEGQSSAPVLITVIGQCCAIGDGAPSPTVSQAFQVAAARNNLSVLLPNPTPVVRSGGGYIQTLTATDGSGAIYAIAESDQSAVAYVIGGALYAAYLADGGFSGPLGYPASDALPGGAQSFASGAALAGLPVRLVPVPIASKWITSGAVTGPVGAPTGNSMAFTSLSGIAGNSQTFSAGTIFGITSGLGAGQAWISTGPILTRYLALSGPSGLLGVPLSDIFTSGAALRQNFETGYIDLQPGATTAVEHYNPRKPAVTAAPGTVAPGGKVQIAISGFAFGATLVVSVTGESNFTVTVPGGEYGWNIAVPLAASAGTIAIQVKSNSTDTAAGSYTIVPLDQLRPSLTVVSGDQQTGAPGAALAAPLVAVLTDSSGNPIPGTPVAYAVSPGARATVSAVTDANGRISASLRLQPAAGIALLSVSAAGQTVTFGAVSSAKAITGFPGVTQLNPQGSLIAALSAAILYYQNLGSFQNSSTSGAPNGLASPASLDQFLAANAGFTASETGTAIANPWVAMKFAGVGGGISVETPSLAHVLDVLNTGSPLVLELSVLVDGAPAGGAAVVAIGVNADGSIAIADPNPAFGRASLADYLDGFSAQGHNIQGSLAGAIRIAPGLTTPGGFVSAAPASSAESVASLAGSCTNSIDIADPVVAVQAAPAKVGAVRFIECDGTQPVYQLGFGTQTGATILDLAGGPALEIGAGSALAWQVTRTNGSLAIGPQMMVITAVVNSAGFGSGLSPGGLFTIFGTGFTAGQMASSVTVGGQPAQVLAAFPFQVNARIPAGMPPGNTTIEMNGPLGTATQTVAILPAAPGIFVILNQDGTLNGPSNPVESGAYLSIYGTGLGATTAQGSLQIASEPVSVVVGGTMLTPSFAGLAPGLTGVYQINVQIPPGTAPGSAIALSVQEAGQTSNTVAVAIQ